MKRVRTSLSVTQVALLVGGCGVSAPQHRAFLETEDAGGLAFRMVVPGDEIVGFRFSISASDTVVEERDVPLEDEALPAHLAEDGEEGHRFSDAYFVLEPGLYDVVATPLVQGPLGLSPSSECVPGKKDEVEVREGVTTEIVVVARCNTLDSGGLDVIAVVNYAPEIVELVFDPSKFVVACEPLTVTVVAEDPDGDPMDYEWQVQGPTGADYEFEAIDNELHFAATTPGEYEATVTVCDTLPDPNTMCASLTFPIHVSLGDDEDGDGMGDLCNVSAASIGDRVWLDEDADGLQDVDEVGEPGVGVTLHKCSGDVVATTTTDVDGRYLFDHVTPGDYFLQYAILPGDVFSPQDQGGDDGQDSDADPTTGRTTCVTLASGESDFSWDVGIHPESSQECAGDVGDRVWLDENADGIQDTYEIGASGVSVTLHGCDRRVDVTTTTDADGHYLFTGVEPGDYYLEYVIPTGYVFSPQDQGGDDGLDSDADPTTGRTQCVALACDEHDLTRDVGIHSACVEECDECDGKVVELTLQYHGGASAHVEVFQGKKPKKSNRLFENGLDPNERFTFVGIGKDGTMGKEISIWVDDERHTTIHTSCSRPIGPGLISGDFEVTEGHSLRGGLLCPIAFSHESNTDTHSRCRPGRSR